MKNPNLWYLAGPMSGVPQFNFPLFGRVADDLRTLGYAIISPAELDDDETRRIALSSFDGGPEEKHESWGTYLARDVKLIADMCKGIIFLPGWRKSRGARLEAFVGILCGHQFMECAFDEEGELDDLVCLDPEYVMLELYNAT